MAKLKLALAQFASGIDPVANLAQIKQLVTSAAEQGADLVVFPEYSMYLDAEQAQPDKIYAETLSGEFVNELKALAATVAIDVIAGITERNGAKLPYNTLVHITATGDLSGVYRKAHLYDAFGMRESESFSSAAPVPFVADIKGVKVGAITCYDLRFPESSRQLTDNGAELIVLPAAWYTGEQKLLHWNTLITARAIENTVFFAGCDQAGAAFTGHSFIADPAGRTLAAADGLTQQLVIAEIDTAVLQQVRETNPVLRNRKFKVLPL